MFCNNKQLHFWCCSCFSPSLGRLFTHFYILIKESSKCIILPSFSFLSYQYSSNLFEIKPSASVSFASCLLSSFIFFIFSQICFICFSTFLIQLNKMLTQSGYFKFLLNAFSGITLALLVLKHPFFNFLVPSSWLELPLRSRFFEL